MYYLCSAWYISRCIGRLEFIFPGGPPIKIVGNQEYFDKEEFLEKAKEEFHNTVNDLELTKKDIKEGRCRYSPNGIEDWNEGCYVLTDSKGNGSFAVWYLEV